MFLPLPPSQILVPLIYFYLFHYGLHVWGDIVLLRHNSQILHAWELHFANANRLGETGACSRGRLAYQWAATRHNTFDGRYTILANRPIKNNFTSLPSKMENTRISVLLPRICSGRPYDGVATHTVE